MINQKKNDYSTLLFAFAGLILCLCVSAGVARASDILVEQAYVRESLPGVSNAAAYMRIKNRSGRVFKLIGVSSFQIPKVEMHAHQHHEGVMAMRPVASVDIPSQGEFLFKPGGHHLMLMGLQQPLVVGEEVVFQLAFEGEEPVKVKAPVSAIGSN